MARRPFLPGAAAMIVLLTLGMPIGCAYLAAARPLAETSVGEILKGRAALEIEDGYEKSIFFRKAAIGTLNAIAYAAFDEARTGAIVGSDGWLFSREEFDRPKEVDENIDRSIAYVVDTTKRLAAEGIDVMVALLPLKADVYREHLGTHRFPAVQDALYPNVLDRLSGSLPFPVPDLRPAMLAAKAEGPVFLQNDTHWTVAGALAVAEAIAAILPERLEFPTRSYLVSTEPSVRHDGDLTKFLDFGPYAGRFALPSEPIAPIRTAASDEDISDLLGSDDGSDHAAVALVGTSFSANPLWSFEAALRSRLRTDVVNYAVEGQGPFKPMTRYLKSLQDGSAAKPRLVVWEIPVRYFLMSDMLPN